MMLSDVWAIALPMYREMAEVQGRLPGYRDWRRAMILMGRDVREIGGLTLLFFAHEPLYNRFVAGKGHRKNLAPRGYFLGFRGDAEVKAEPLYRQVDVADATSTTKPVSRPVCVWSEWVAALGYTVTEGREHQIQGHHLVLPRRDPVDHAAEVVRIVAHLEWQRAGGAGTLGGELMYLLLAPHFRLDLTAVRCPRALIEAIRRETPVTMTEISLRAAALAVLALENLGPDHVRAYLDTLDTTTVPETAPLFGMFGGSP